jgi:Rrf2 family transcriptional regulator, nitric oxide-sensitive transcriptional repressor
MRIRGLVAALAEIGMRLTSHTDYSLRTLIYLGVRADRLSSVGQVADAYGLSKNHLMKVANHLASGGYVVAVRGNRGGIRLARSPEDINIGQVVRHTESDMNIAECFCPGPGSGCRIESGCLLRAALRNALRAFLAVLDGYTLANLLQSRPLLEELLGVGSSGQATDA